MKKINLLSLQKCASCLVFRFFYGIPLVFFFYLLPAKAIVSSDSIAGTHFSPGWNTRLSNSLSLSRGNVDQLKVGGDVLVVHSADFQDQVLATLDGEFKPIFQSRQYLHLRSHFAEARGNTFIKNHFVQFRNTKMLNGRWGVVGLLQFENDEFRLLDTRAVAAAMVRFEALRTEKVHVWLNTGYLPEYEKLDLAATASEQDEHFNHRWSTQLTVGFPIVEDKITFSNTLYYQPRIDKFTDYRLLDILDMNFQVTKKFSLGFNFVLAYDSEPPDGVRREDVQLSQSFRFQL